MPSDGRSRRISLKNFLIGAPAVADDIGDRIAAIFRVSLTARPHSVMHDAMRLWASGMLEPKTVNYKFKLTAVALANKVARIVFVLMIRGGQYDDRPVAT